MENDKRTPPMSSDEFVTTEWDYAGRPKSAHVSGRGTASSEPHKLDYDGIIAYAHTNLRWETASETERFRIIAEAAKASMEWWVYDLQEQAVVAERSRVTHIIREQRDAILVEHAASRQSRAPLPRGQRGFIQGLEHVLSLLTEEQALNEGGA